MQYELTEEQRAIQDLARRLASDGDWEGLARKWDAAAAFDRTPVTSKLRETGLAGMTIPKEYGGGGAGFLDFIVAYEQIARVNYTAAFLLSSSCSGPIDSIVQFGSDAVRRKFLPKLANGEWLAAIAITEPDAGSDIGAIRTRAIVEGDTVRINGNKIYVGGGGDFEVYVVFVRMSDAPGVDGLGCVVVDRASPGLKFGPKFRMLGSRPVPRSEIIFDDCIIPREQVLLGPGGFRQMIEVFNGERIHNATLALGLAQGAFEHASQYAKDRIQFNKRLADFQGIQWKLAEMQTLLSASRLMIYRAAAAKDAGAALGVLASEAKLFAATYCPKVVDQALQIEGAFGYSEGSRVERAYRDIRLVPIAGGSVEMMLNYLGGRIAR